MTTPIHFLSLLHVSNIFLEWFITLIVGLCHNFVHKAWDFKGISGQQEEFDFVGVFSDFGLIVYQVRLISSICYGFLVFELLHLDYLLC